MKFIFLCLGLGLFLPFARAEHRDNDRDRHEPRIILYQHADFQGSFLVLYPGDSIDNLSGKNYPNGGGLNDTISSVRVEGGAAVFVYEQARFRGAVMRVTENARDLTARSLPDNPKLSWNDRISSFRVEGTRSRRDGEREADVDVVIKRAYQDLLGRAPDPTGLRYYHGAMIDQGWTERMVRDHIRRGEEFRREGADRIIRRAYQDLLGREPDENGLRNYRKKMIDHDWSETEVRDNIRRSQEYLSRPPERK
jgi:Peptidase inhibitor family I36